MVVSEMEPFVKTGGLGDVAGALPLALGRLGVEMHLFLPRYALVKEKKLEVKLSSAVTVHFVDHPEYYRRGGLYGGQDGDYPDNLERFSFFCRQVFSLIRAARFQPDVLHAHDWQAALSVVYLANLFREDPVFSRVGSVFTVHNLAYQGLFLKEQFPKLGLPWSLFGINGLEFYDRINLLKGGLLFAGAVSTVSPTYAKEIQTREQGEGLEGVLQMRSKDLTGILNGIDQQVWDPRTDPAISQTFDPQQLNAKQKNKAALQKEMGLPADPDAFLIGMVTRLASQKGIDLVVQALPKLTRLGVQIAVLGSGDRPIEQSLSAAARKSGGLKLRLDFDNQLARRIYAGSDAFLMPSRYEPCGLGQMIAMRYGTPPIVRRTGGLADTVSEFRPSSRTGNGFCFESAVPQQLIDAVNRALSVYRQPSLWQQVQRRGMETDFSWDRSAKEYLHLYEQVCRR